MKRPMWSIPATTAQRNYYNRLHKPSRNRYGRSKYGIKEVQELRRTRGVGSVRRIRRITEVPSFTLDQGQPSTEI
jgi:hypothetical protein